MIVKNNYKNALVHIQCEEKDKSKASKGIIVAVPKRYHQIDWKIDWGNMNICCDAERMKKENCIVYLKDFDNLTITIIPSRLRQAKVFKVENLDNFNKLMRFYCSKLSK